MKKIKTAGITVLLFAIAVIFCACKKETAAEPETTQTETARVEAKAGSTIKKGELLVGIRPGSTPYITGDEDGKVEGFEIDLAKAIGDLTFLEVKFVEMDYKDIYAELDTSRFDCVISAARIDKDVDKVYDFSLPYYTDEEGNEYAIVVKSGNNRLLNVLNQSLAILEQEGTLETLYELWFSAQEETTAQDAQ